MKEYIIWLDSGECINGTAEEPVLKDLQQRFKNKSDDIISFSDTEGETVIDMSKVQAIAANKLDDKSIIGFIK